MAEDRRENLLRSAGWAGATAVTVAGDASARRFTRLFRADGASAILMDASAEANGSSRRFADLSAWINANGFSAPRILARDLDAGLLLIEDFGDVRLRETVEQAHPLSQRRRPA